MPLIAPDVSPEPVRPPELRDEASPSTFGGGQGLEQAGQQIQKIASDAGEIAAFETIRHDQTAVEEAVGSKLSPALTQMLYNPKDGALAKITQSGSVDEALKIQKDTLDQYNKTAKGIASDLHGESQVGAFNKHAFAFGDTLNKTLMAHVDQQIKAHDTKSFDSFVDNTITQDALGWGLHLTDPDYQKSRVAMLQDHVNEFAFRQGMGADEKKGLESRVMSDYHAQITNRMLADGQYATADKYFEANKDSITDLKTRDSVERNIEIIPKQQKEAAKQQREEKYTQNERQSLLDIADGKMSLSEVDRMYRNDDIDKTTYELLERKVSDPTYLDRRTMDTSDPVAFNAIREAQLRGDSPRDITRMITHGMSDKTDDGKRYKISPDDVKYLTNATRAVPPSPRDKEIEASANSIRDFGNRYFDSDSPMFGNLFNAKDKAEANRSSQSEALVQDFYRQVDKEKAQGERLVEIRDEIQKRAVAQKFPGLKGKDLPDVVVNVHGQVIKLLDPDHKSKVKAAYKITPTTAQDVDQE